MKKIVDGTLVDMSPVEAAQRQAEETAWASRPPAKDGKNELVNAIRAAKNLEELKDALIGKDDNPGVGAGVKVLP